MEKLIDKLKKLNIRLKLSNDKLEISSSKGVIDEALLKEIKLNKENIISFLKKYERRKSNYISIKTVEQKPCYTLSSAQRRLWILSQFEDNSVAYNVPSYFYLEGNYDFNCFKQAIDLVIDRYEILRTVFKENENGDIKQHILSRKDLSFELHFEDYSKIKDPQVQLKKYLQQKAYEKFDLENGPLIRGTLIQLPSERYVFSVVLHHIICDGWSIEILKENVMNFYNNIKEGKVIDTPPLNIQYKEYAEWQLKQLNGKLLSEHKKYWNNQLGGEQILVDLPTSKKRPLIKTTNGKTIGSCLSNEVTLSLNRFCKEKEGSLFMGLLTITNILFYKYTSQNVIVMGTPTAGRDHMDLEDQIGLFVNTLALKNEVLPEFGFVKLFSEFKKNVLEAFKYQQYPFDRLVEDLDIAKDSSRSPIFDIMIILQNTGEKKEKYLESNVDQIVDLDGNKSLYDITLEFEEIEDYISFEITYNTDVYERSVIENFIKHFKILAKNLLDKPEKEIRNIDYMSDNEKNKLLKDFNNTTREYAKNIDVISLFQEQALKTPNNTAVLYKGNTLTFKELNELANKLCKYFYFEQGIRKEDKVLILLKHSHNLMAVLLAVKKLGAICITVDPKTPVARIDYIRKDSNSTLTITEKIVSEGLSFREKRELPIVKSEDEKGDKIECIIYTSGSTGKPKGVLIKSYSIINRLHWIWNNYPFEEGEVCVAKTSISFVDHISEFFSPLLKGIPLVFYEIDEIVDIPILINRLEEQKITRIVLVPTLLRAILKYPNLCKEKLNSLKLWISSGETLKKNDIIKFYKTLDNTNVRLLNIYGSTEVTADAMYYDTYNKYNKSNKFKLYDSTIKDRIDELVCSYDSSTKIFSEPWNELIKKKEFKDVNLDTKQTLNEYVSYIKSDILPNVVNVGSTSFIGHMTGMVPNIFRELASLVIAINQNQVKVDTSMVSTLIEKQIVGIFHNMIYGGNKEFYDKYVQSPDYSLGIVTNGGTMSNLMFLNYTLNKLLKEKENFGGIRKEGLIEALRYYGYDKVAVIGSQWCHYSINKSLSLLGLGTDSFVEVDFENKSQLQIEKDLRLLITKLRSQNTLILGIVGIAGTTESGNIEPLTVLGQISDEFNIHFHVDAAFGGSFLMDDQLKKKLEGIQFADTVTICAHKQLYLPMGLSLCVFKSPSFALASENNTHYQARKGSYDLGRFTMEGSKSFMSLILHGAFSVFGKEGFAEIIRHNYKTAQDFADFIKEDPDFELFSKPDLNIVLYRYIPNQLRDKVVFTNDEIEFLNDFNLKIQNTQFSKKESFVSYTSIKDKSSKKLHLFFRTVFMNPYTTFNELKNIIEEQRSIAYKLEGKKYENLRSSVNENILIGKPIENVKVYICDEFLNILPVGISGEICIAGDCVSAGYMSSEKGEENKFLRNPFGNGNIYRTGDLGRMTLSGDVQFIGRKDNLIKISGKRVSLGEIESQIHSYKGISEVAIIDRKIDDEAVILVAYLVTKEYLDLSDLKRYLLEMLPDYMLPSKFVFIEKLPLTSSGKVNRKMLIEIEGKEIDAKIEYIAPRNEKERVLVSICKALLEKEKICIKQSFYSIGGDSIKLIQLIFQLKKKGYLIKPEEIIQSVDLESLAKLLVDNKEVDKKNLEFNKKVNFQSKHWKVADRIEISENQFQMMKFQQAQGVIGPCRIQSLDKEEIELRFRKFLNFFPVLCIGFSKENNIVFQEFVGADKTKLNFHYDQLDFSNPQSFEKINKTIFEKPFDVLNEEAIRLYVYENSVNPEEQCLYLSLHHSIADLFTVNIVKNQLIRFIETGNVLENDRPFTNMDFVSWQKQYLLSERAQISRKFWTKYLKTIDYEQKGKYNFTRRDLLGDKGIKKEYVEKSIVLTDHLFEEVKYFSRKIKTPISAILMGFHQWLLYDLFGDQMGFQSVIVNGRENSFEDFDTEKILGVINNYLPLKITSPKYEQGNYERFLKNVYGNYLNAREHQLIPFETIRKDFLGTSKTDIDLHNLGVFNFKESNEFINTKETNRLKSDTVYSTNTIGLDMVCLLGNNGIEISIISTQETLSSIEINYLCFNSFVQKISLSTKENQVGVE